eukprot:SAG11_NODE_1532_length_4732_cov_4.721563_5_plen_211_part_00
MKADGGCSGPGRRRLLPLRLSPLFLDLVLGRAHQTCARRADGGGGGADGGVVGGGEGHSDSEHLTMLSMLSTSGIQGGAQVSLCLDEMEAVRAGRKTVAEAEAMIQACDMYFVDPAALPQNQAQAARALCDGGAEKQVTWANLEEFLRCLSAAWFEAGVARQLAAFRRALFQVCAPLRPAGFGGNTAARVRRERSPRRAGPCLGPGKNVI